MILFKKILGVILILVGLFALVTPLTPGSWLALIGLELLGIRLVIWDNIKAKYYPNGYPRLKSETKTDDTLDKK